MKSWPLLLVALPTVVHGQGSADAIDSLLNGWHHAAAVADEKAYFGAMDSSAVYLGTDPGERWSKQAFHDWAKPQFDKGSAWAFVPFDRHITLGPQGVAWFDEKLKWKDTRLNIWMTGLRGSGVVRRTATGWLIEQYNLTMELPNDRIGDVIRLLRATPAVAPADARAIFGAVRGFLSTRVTGDSAKIRGALAPDARIRITPGPDSVSAWNTAWASTGARDSTPEVMLMGDSSLATVWAPFSSRLAHQLVACGVEQFELMKQSASWAITSVTVHTAPCEDRH